jgi:hypothetical protein
LLQFAAVAHTYLITQQTKMKNSQPSLAADTRTPATPSLSRQSFIGLAGSVVFLTTSILLSPDTIVDAAAQILLRVGAFVCFGYAIAWESGRPHWPFGIRHWSLLALSIWVCLWPVLDYSIALHAAVQFDAAGHPSMRDPLADPGLDLQIPVVLVKWITCVVILALGYLVKHCFDCGIGRLRHF